MYGTLYYMIVRAFANSMIYLLQVIICDSIQIGMGTLTFGDLTAFLQIIE